MRRHKLKDLSHKVNRSNIEILESVTDDHWTWVWDKTAGRIWHQTENQLIHQILKQLRYDRSYGWRLTMSNQYDQQGISITEGERPTGELRWYLRSPLPDDKKLQQCWEIIEYLNGKPSGRRVEWRDVPSERGF